MIQPIYTKNLPNTISVDVEEYYHAENLSPVAPRRRWPYLPSRVVESTEGLIALLANSNSKATFFVLGSVARRNKSLVRTIVENGHEIASHGFRHKLAYKQTPDAFYRDVYTSKKLLEDICGKEVIGYRAPNFSITDDTAWGHEMLFKAGYRYDSSVYPTKHPRYSNTNKPCEAFYQCIDDDKKLIVFPLAVAKLTFGSLSLPLPVAGGAYWRLLPSAYINWGLRKMQRQQVPANCYVHPWEFDSDQPRFVDLPFLTKVRHYGGNSHFAKKFSMFLNVLNFTTLKSSYDLILADENLSGEAKE